MLLEKYRVIDVYIFKVLQQKKSTQLLETLSRGGRGRRRPWGGRCRARWVCAWAWGRAARLACPGLCLGAVQTSPHLVASKGSIANHRCVWLLVVLERKLEPSHHSGLWPCSPLCWGQGRLPLGRWAGVIFVPSGRCLLRWGGGQGPSLSCGGGDKSMNWPSLEVTGGWRSHGEN